ncbi:MAG TPA: hypothetical protein VM681_11185 [Candidatus Thermoplasmatota archaeon]|nr:hypothetical protein [Candidatus Thermoplasmatota archaeon]
MALAELADLAPYLVVSLSEWQTYGLFFLLGSFAVASLSDIRHLSAQREFMEFWIVFALVMLVLDAAAAGFALGAPLLAKWALVALLSVLSWERVGGVFALARADVAALAAAASLLSAFLVVLFFLFAKALSYPLGRLLRKGQYYPFLPVVTLATIVLMAVALWLPPFFPRPS